MDAELLFQLLLQLIVFSTAGMTHWIMGNDLKGLLERLNASWK